jgi:hypothetical protein
VIVTSAGFSALGPGVASRTGSIVWFLWLALLAFRLLRLSEDTTSSGTLPATGHE